MLKTGDKRKIKSYEENGKTISGRNCGKWCTIVKVFTDEEGQRFCRVRIDGQEAVSSLDYTEDNFYPKYEDISFAAKIDPDNDMIELTISQDGTQVSAGYGRIDNDSLAGVAQAFSYAAKRAWLKLDPGFFADCIPAVR